MATDRMRRLVRLRRSGTIDTVTVIHLVRHGEVSNDTGVVYGRLPGFHLSVRGRLMASVLADHFRDQPISHVVSSPLERAQETAEPIGHELGLTVRTDERMIEAGNHFEGTRFGYAQLARHPLQLRFLANPFRPSWGETYRSQADRVQEALRDVRAEAYGRAAVIVSHQAPIWTARRTLEGARPWSRPLGRECALGSVTTFTYVADTGVAVAYADPFSAYEALKE